MLLTPMKQNPKIQMNDHIKHILKELYVTEVDIDNGISQYICWSKKCDSPVGFLWIRFRISQCGLMTGDILNCYTVEWARKQGIAKYLYDYVLSIPEVISLTTPMGTDTGGKEFLKKYGFNFNEDIGLWTYAK